MHSECMRDVARVCMGNSRIKRIRLISFSKSRNKKSWQLENIRFVLIFVWKIDTLCFLQSNIRLLRSISSGCANNKGVASGIAMSSSLGHYYYYYYCGYVDWMSVKMCIVALKLERTTFRVVMGTMRSCYRYNEMPICMRGLWTRESTITCAILRDINYIKTAYKTFSSQ